MKLRVKNKAAEKSGISPIPELIWGSALIVVALYYCFVSVKTLFFGDGPISAGLFLLCPTLLFVYTSVYHADCTMRYFKAEETISIQDGCLVNECTHTLFRRRKRIPLSAIRDIKPYTNHTRFPIPDTLRGYYGHDRRYRFGIFMTPGQADELAKRILSEHIIISR